jgi:hypothetical protein
MNIRRINSACVELRNWKKIGRSRRKTFSILSEFHSMWITRWAIWDEEKKRRNKKTSSNNNIISSNIEWMMNRKKFCFFFFPDHPQSLSSSNSLLLHLEILFFFCLVTKNHERISSINFLQLCFIFLPIKIQNFLLNCKIENKKNFIGKFQAKFVV